MRWPVALGIVVGCLCVLALTFGVAMPVSGDETPSGTTLDTGHDQRPLEIEHDQKSLETGHSQKSTTSGSCPRSASAHPDGEDAPPDETGKSALRIVELYPNPTTDQNVGEYVVLETPPERELENVTITDGHTTAAVPNETVSGRVALSMDPPVTESMTEYPVLEFEGYLRLSAAGDELEVRDGNRTVDTVAYDDGPLAERWYRASATADDEVGSGNWWPRGATCLPVTNATVADATAFVLPDTPAQPLEPIRSADDRIYVAGYTMTAASVASELVAASDRGVDVTVLLESGPVGGVPAETKAVIETLVDADIEVRAIGGEGARYRFHHPKYAVADDEVLVMTENWNPSGVGGASSRGWGIRLENEQLADDLATVFEADFDGHDTTSAETFLAETSFVDDDAPSGQYPSTYESKTVPVDSAELLLAPDNAEPRLRELIDGAEEELLVKQPRIGDPSVSLLKASIDAARRGVDVKLLLDSTWYVEDENQATKETLEEIADREDLPLEVKLVEPGDRFEKIHSKGIVIDRSTTVVGSINWNDNSLQNNREVMVVVHGEQPAAYYAAVFEDDWNGESWTMPIGFTATTILVLVSAAYIGSRHIRFGTPTLES